MTETASAVRVYFVVLDIDGRAFPAVEYWANVIESNQPVDAELPLRRFLKLIGSDESRIELGDGVFMGMSTGRKFFRLSSVG